MADFLRELKLTVKETTGATVTLPSVQTAFVRKSLFFDRYADRLAALIEAVDAMFDPNWGHGAITCPDCLEALDKMRAARVALDQPENVK